MELMTNEEYAGSEQCPNCRSSDTDSTAAPTWMAAFPSRIVVGMECHQCGVNWTAIFGEIGYEDLNTKGE
jgi:hypothetical protein